MKSYTAVTLETCPHSRVAIAILVALTAIRIFVSANSPLLPDEAYYWVWSRALAPGYFDHPFMVALWIRLGTLLGGESNFGVRLLSPLAAAFGSVLLIDAANRLFPNRCLGWTAAALLNATVLFGVGAVTITPDTPLLFFWTLALWSLARLATHASPMHWLMVGVSCGLALDSKYTAALLAIGIAAWLLTPAMRFHLRTPWPWLGGSLMVATFLPVILWNASHGWASFIKQGGRTGSWDFSRAFRFVAELLGGQVGLVTPLIIALFTLGIVGTLRRWRTPAGGLLTALVLPGILVFLLHALGDRVQANWVAILYPGAALAAAELNRRWWLLAVAFGFAVTALVYVQATWSPLNVPNGFDPTLRAAGWDKLALDAEAIARREGAGFLASEDYGSASLLSWYNSGMPVLAAGSRWSLFALPTTTESSTGVLLLSTRRREPPDLKFWHVLDTLETLRRHRKYVSIEEFKLYRVIPRTGAPIVTLPSRTAQGF